MSGSVTKCFLEKKPYVFPLPCKDHPFFHLIQGEGTFGANAGLPDVAVGLLKPISEKYVPDTISNADLWALAANVAIKVEKGKM